MLVNFLKICGSLAKKIVCMHVGYVEWRGVDCFERLW